MAVAPSATLRALEGEAVRMVKPLASSGGNSWGNALFKQKIKPQGCSRLDFRVPVRLNRKARIAFPAVCLLHGLGGPFWDAADSPADDQYSPMSGYNRKGDKAVLLGLVQKIEPLDVSTISKEASADSMDAMKRTISGMLGVLPSDQFKVTVEAYREPLKRLLVSSMMTGYTLRNAEYRLCLQRSLQLSEEDSPSNSQQPVNDSEDELRERRTSESFAETSSCSDVVAAEEEVEEFKLPKKLQGILPREVEEYVHQLQAKLRSSEKNLEDCKRAKTALEMEKIVGDEKNDLLDYLRSLEPDKVAELSHPASKEVEEVIQIVIDGLLDGLCKSRPSKPPQVNGLASAWDKINAAELANAPLKFQSTVTASRDYLARLLFWCMLLGHHMRGLEYRVELSHALSISGVVEMGVDE